MRIYLIGMPGCGKSTLGKRLASKLNYEFIDMDNYIERQAGMFIDELFEAYGEDFFRCLETNTLKEFLNMDNIVIATGGGVIKNKDHKEIMAGKCIYLKVDLDDLQNRLNQSPIIRPLLKTKSVNELYEERKELYDYFADLIVDNTNLEEAINNILVNL
ncbi:MAG: shikimate kinase [Anaeroplasma sp.]